MTFRTILAATTALSFIAGAAIAVPVTLDFEGGTSTGTSEPGGNAASGTWEEEGFVVDWDFYSDATLPPTLPTDFNGFRFLSDFEPDGGVDVFGTEMTLKRADGGTFSLKGAKADFTYEGFGVFADFTPEAPGGSAESFTAPLLRPNLKFTGMTEGGGTVIAEATTGDPAALSPADPDFRFGPSDAAFGPGVLESLMGLTSLKIEVLDPPAGSATSFFDNAAIAALEAYGAPQGILDGLDACGGFQSCDVSGVGSYLFTWDFFGNRNDFAAVEIGSLSFHVDAPGGGGSNGPAPIPLPASAWLLLAGLGALTVGRFRRG